MGDRLVLEGLEIRAGDRILVHDVGFCLEAGEVLAMVGASGSGKTLTARSLLGLRGPLPGVTAGSLEVRVGDTIHRPYEGLPDVLRVPSREREILRLQDRWRAELERRFRRIRGGVVGYLPQDARGALNPLWTVERIVAEAVRMAGSPRPPAFHLERAGFAHPEEVLGLHPHQLSGGMAQRVCIALTMARGSRFVVADEPTTALDPTVQQEILAELAETAAEGVGILLITHDLRLVPRLARKVVILHAGRVAEALPAADLSRVTSPQGRALLDATARVGGGLL